MSDINLKIIDIFPTEEDCKRLQPLWDAIHLKELLDDTEHYWWEENDLSYENYLKGLDEYLTTKYMPTIKQNVISKTFSFQELFNGLYSITATNVKLPIDILEIIEEERERAAQAMIKAFKDAGWLYNNEKALLKGLANKPGSLIL